MQDDIDMHTTDEEGSEGERELAKPTFPIAVDSQEWQIKLDDIQKYWMKRKTKA